ncbi:MAG: sugar transferase [Bacteroidetes bacterium]|nr:sugar transferase [Bacteroidota bacterium]
MSGYKRVKRVFDVTASLSGLLVASPIMLLAAVALKLESKGPVFYSSPRVGEGYKTFGMIKFRSMYTNADKQTELMKKLNQYQQNGVIESESKGCPFCEMLNRPCSPMLVNDNETICENSFIMRKDTMKPAAFFKISNDPRVTRVGKFLRLTSIGELPQLFNILKGDMSLIGNRPLPVYEAEKLTTDHAIERFNAPAGLTGLWQVTKRGKETVSEQERVELDRTYAKKFSFKTDVLILLKTIPALFKQENV